MKKEERRRTSYKEPAWFTEESNRLIDEWSNTKTNLSVDEYAAKHGSDRYRAELKHAMAVM